MSEIRDFLVIPTFITGFIWNFLLFSPEFVINDKSNISIYMLLKYNKFIFIIMIYKINEYYILAINIKTIFTAINTQKL